MKDIYGDTMTKDGPWLHLNVIRERHVGARWHITAQHLEKGIPHNYRDTEPLDDFAISAYFRDPEQLRKYPEQKNDLVYGVDWGYYQPYRIDNGRCQMMAKFLAGVRRSLDAQYKTYGATAGFTEDVMRIAVAIQAKGFFRQTKAGHDQMWTSGEYQFFNPSEARYHIEHVHQDYLKEIFPEEVAA